MDNIEVKNLGPNFLKFYNLANEENMTLDDRWQLWKEHYGFAAVPPGEDGKKWARNLLDEAWTKYEESMNYIETFEPDLDRLESYLTDIKSLLGCNEPIDLVIIYFVGGFENNAFVAPTDEGRAALCLPIEGESTDVVLTHELTHIVHSKTAGLTTQWERSVASLILQEGLATHVSRYMIPGEDDENYIEYTEGWLKSCRRKSKSILEGIYPYFEDSESDTIFKFTFGSGTTGHEREAYFVGWEFVGRLLDEGVSFKEMANVEEADIPKYMKDNYPVMKGSKKNHQWMFLDRGNAL